MFEQWSLIRSIDVSKSENIKPSSIVHLPSRKRLTWRSLSSFTSLSITCSSGSILFASSMSFLVYALVVLSTISIRAHIKTSISLIAFSEKNIFFSCISLTDSCMFTAWSLILSKSPIECSIFEVSALSSVVKLLLLSLTRYVPKTSS